MKQKLKNSLAKQLLVFVFGIMISLLLAYLITNSYVSSSIQKNTLDLNNKILLQIEGKLKNFYESMNHIAISLSYSPTTEAFFNQNNLERVILSNDLLTVFSNTMLLEDDIIGIYLFDMEMNQIAAMGKMNDGSGLVDQIKDRIEFSNLFLLNQAEVYYIICCPVFDLNSQQYGRQMGMCVLLMKTDNFKNLLADSQATEHSEIYLLDGKNNIIASSDGVDMSYLSSDMQITTKTYLVQCNTNVAMKEWSVVSRIPRHELYSNMGGGKELVMIAYGIACVLICILTYFCYRNFILRIYKIDRFIKDIIENPKGRMRENRMDEIGTVIHSLNQMLDDKEKMNEEIQDSQKRMYEIKIAKKQLQVLAYRNQINPHFLYNTLDCIRGMALYHDEEDIAQITMALSKVFRFAVKGNNIVTVEEEIDYIKEYATIIDYRFMGKIKVKFDIEEALFHKHVLKLMLQPIVENAVFHGLEQKMNGGLVRVTICKYKDNDIKFIVEDNGRGMEPEKVEQIQSILESEMSNKSVGLANIYQRLNLFYGKDMDFLIKSKLGKGTRIEIIIPDHVVEEDGKYV